MRDQKNLIRKTRLKMLILAVMATLTTFSVVAQNTNITLPPSKLSAKELFDNIQKQTSYKVAASINLTDKLSVTINRSPITVKSALDKLLAGSGLVYRVDGNHIIITQGATPQTASVVAVNTVHNVAGTVTDGENTLEGVKVQIMDFAGKEAVTNVQGRFLIGGITPGRHVAKLTSADGQSIRFREISVTTGKDADVKLEFGGALMQTATQSDIQAAQTVSTTKTTAYFIPNTQDHTVRAFNDEPKTSYSFVPEQSITGNGGQYLPKFGIKTNLLYWATTTPNIAFEFGLARKWTMEVGFGLNPWDLNDRNGGIRHWLVQPEFRYWFCQRFEKHFIGLHGIYGQYQIMDVKLPLKDLTNERYDGWGAGAGISYGYHLPMAKRWAWEFTAGAGYIYFDYDKYRCGTCDKYAGNYNKHYFGVTKAGISLIFMIK